MWIVFAIAASVFWGITYVINEQVYKHISVVSSIALTLLAAGAAVGLYALLSGTLAKDAVIILSSNKVLFLVIAGIVMLILAEVFIGLSIASKNATIAGLIEISYPIFIALFSYLLFKESHLNLGTFLGGLLIFLGIAVIYLFNR